MIHSYYFWKWADNDLPGRPVEVQAALLRGEIHQALQPFDAHPLLKKLKRAATAGRKRDEEWAWEVVPPASPARAAFVFVTCPRLNQSKERVARFEREFRPLGLSGFDEQNGQLMPCLPPKLTCFINGQLPEERNYDIAMDDLPYLLRRIDSHREDPFGVLQDRHSRFVQCYAHGRRFCVEWQESPIRGGERNDDLWRAQDATQLAALGGSYDGRAMPVSKVPDVLRYADTLRIFAAFLRGEPRPAQYPWRNVNHLIP